MNFYNNKFRLAKPWKIDTPTTEEVEMAGVEEFDFEKLFKFVDNTMYGKMHSGAIHFKIWGGVFYYYGSGDPTINWQSSSYEVYFTNSNINCWIEIKIGDKIYDYDYEIIKRIKELEAFL